MVGSENPKHDDDADDDIEDDDADGDDDDDDIWCVPPNAPAAVEGSENGGSAWHQIFPSIRIANADADDGDDDDECDDDDVDDDGDHDNDTDDEDDDVTSIKSTKSTLNYHETITSWSIHAGYKVSNGSILSKCMVSICIDVSF